MSEELNNHRPYTAAELSEMLHNERASWAEEVNALGHAIGFDRVQQAGSILEAVRQLASRPAPAVQVPEGWRLVPVELTDAMRPHLRCLTTMPASVWECLLDAAPTPATVATEAVAQAPLEVWVDEEFTTEAMQRLCNHLRGEGKPILADCLMGLAKQRDNLKRYWVNACAEAGELTEEVGHLKKAVAQGGGVELACTNQALLGWGDARRVAKALIEDGYVMRHELEEAVRCIATVNKEEQP